jgi:hypothetical protein
MSLKSHIPLPRVLYVGCASITKACHNRSPRQSRCRHLSDLQGEQTAHISGAVPQIILPYPGSHADWSENRGNGHFIVSPVRQRVLGLNRIKARSSCRLLPVHRHVIYRPLRDLALGSTRCNSAISHLATQRIPFQVTLATRTKAITPRRQFIRHGCSSLGGLHGVEQKIWSLNRPFPSHLC